MLSYEGLDNMGFQEIYEKAEDCFMDFKKVENHCAGMKDQREIKFFNIPQKERE